MSDNSRNKAQHARQFCILTTSIHAVQTIH